MGYADNRSMYRPVPECTRLDSSDFDLAPGGGFVTTKIGGTARTNIVLTSKSKLSPSADRTKASHAGSNCLRISDMMPLILDASTSTGNLRPTTVVIVGGPIMVVVRAGHRYYQAPGWKTECPRNELSNSYSPAQGTDVRFPDASRRLSIPPGASLARSVI